MASFSIYYYYLQFPIVLTFTSSYIFNIKKNSFVEIALVSYLFLIISNVNNIKFNIDGESEALWFLLNLIQLIIIFVLLTFENYIRHKITSRFYTCLGLVLGLSILAILIDLKWVLLH